MQKNNVRYISTYICSCKRVNKRMLQIKKDQTVINYIRLIYLFFLVILLSLKNISMKVIYITILFFCIVICIHITRSYIYITQI